MLICNRDTYNPVHTISNRFVLGILCSLVAVRDIVRPKIVKQLHNDINKPSGSQLHRPF